jgi:protocatechuate 3,4-dioxygenase beta subunit
MNSNSIVSRRQLVIGGGALGLAAPVAAQNVLDALKVSTRADQLGPYYPIARPLDQDGDLTRLAGHRGVAKGTIIDVFGRVTNNLGNAVANARLDLWQANSVGRYMHPGDTSDLPLDPDFQGSAILTTDAEGKYRLRTIIPGIYPVGDSVRPRHIHWDVRTANARLTTQMYFPGEKENALEKIGDDDNRVAKAAESLEGGVAAFRWDVIVPFG